MSGPTHPVDEVSRGHSAGAAGRAALLATVAIRAYQFTLAPLLGGQCRFVPSCSAYALAAVNRHGAVRGLALAGRRVLRCHPWHEGGFDPVPPANGTEAGAWRSAGQGKA